MTHPRAYLPPYAGAHRAAAMPLKALARECCADAWWGFSRPGEATRWLWATRRNR